MTIPFSSWGKSIGINVSSVVSITEDVQAIDTTKTFYAGRALTIDSTSKKLVPVETNIAVLGLGRFNKNVYIDETFGSYGMYGSGLGSVVMFGVVEVTPNYFNDSTGAEIVVANVVAGMTSANPLDPVYVCTTSGADLGKLTTAVSSNINTRVGYLLQAPTADYPVAKIFVTK